MTVYSAGRTMIRVRVSPALTDASAPGPQPPDDTRCKGKHVPSPGAVLPFPGMDLY